MMGQREAVVKYSASRHLVDPMMAISHGPDSHPDDVGFRNPNELKGIDDWGDVVCERCPLDDCVKPSGILRARQLDARRG